MPRKLGNDKPRRYADHRTRVAKEWSEGYQNIAEVYPPHRGLDRDHLAMAADFRQDYLKLRANERAGQNTPTSPLRKTAGIYLAIVRILGSGLAVDNGRRMPPTPAELLAGLREDTPDGD